MKRKRTSVRTTIEEEKLWAAHSSHSRLARPCLANMREREEEGAMARVEVRRGGGLVARIVIIINVIIIRQ